MNEQDKNQKKIFEEEQAHLTQTHGKLRAMKEELEERINTISEKAAKEKQDIRSNLSLNFDSDTDSMETYIEFEAMSHSITQYNIEQDAAAEKLGRVKRLLKAPYFARVKLQFDPSEKPEDYYIGSAGVSENAFEHLVIDWRSPIAETYYNQENGKTFYTVNGKRVDVDLQLRRQYNLEEDRLYSFFDTQVAIEDPMLLQSLASSRTDKMKAITATIQKEQNAVIRCADVPVLLVNGIAGSGKTSVLLQRIAYLFYRQRENLRPDQVYLLTINPVFRQYIDQVLPDLGEENPRTITQGALRACRGSGPGQNRARPEEPPPRGGGFQARHAERQVRPEPQGDQESIRGAGRDRDRSEVHEHPGRQAGGDRQGQDPKDGEGRQGKRRCRNDRRARSQGAEPD